MSDRPMISLDNCDGVRSVLPRFLDGESGPLEEQRICSHLASCSGCRAMHDRQRDELLLTMQTLTGVEDAEVTQLNSATMEMIAAQSNRNDAPAAVTELPPSRPPIGGWWSSAAVLLLAILLFSGISTRTSVTEPDAATTSSTTLVRGDVDANGRLEWADFHEMVDWLREDGPQPRCLAAGDLDEDGIVTIEDSLLALAHLGAGTELEVTLHYPRGSSASLPCLDVCP